MLITCDERDKKDTVLTNGNIPLPELYLTTGIRRREIIRKRTGCSANQFQPVPTGNQTALALGTETGLLSASSKTYRTVRT
jgi:hypothetical protein